MAKNKKRDCEKAAARCRKKRERRQGDEEIEAGLKSHHFGEDDDFEDDY